MTKTVEDKTVFDVMIYLRDNQAEYQAEPSRLIRKIIQMYEDNKAMEPRAVTPEEMKAKKYDEIITSGYKVNF